MAIYPDWYKDALIGMTGSTTTRRNDGLWVFWYNCNGGLISKIPVKGADGGRFVLLSSVTNEHCSFDQFNASNSSPLRLSLIGIDGFEESYSTFMKSTIIQDREGTQPLDMALVTVLASANSVNGKITPMDISRFIPASQVNQSPVREVRGIGIPWSNSHSFSFFSGFMGLLDSAGEFPTYDINSIPGLSGTLALYENGDISGVPGLVSATSIYATNESWIVGNPDNIQVQLSDALRAHMEYLEGLGYVPIP